ncbi:MAG: lipid-A-disaccharide synthase [Bacteroidales bacterium]|nr:lipid-A-disaccharide synthase [Bacteroidales bacterium]
MSKLVYFVVGEPSGDILASRLMRALRVRQPDIRFAGIGGETMIEFGFSGLFPISDLSVMGFWEVMPRLPLILKRMRQIVSDIEMQRPDVLVTVDSWGFVSKMLMRLKKRGIDVPKVHYVAPQVWAWKKSRAPKAAKLLHHLMTLLPHEPPYFEKYGLSCTFVGHPVIENTTDLPEDQTAFKIRNKIPERCTLIAVLPGSRHSEIGKLAPIFGKVVQQLLRQYHDLFLVIPTIAAIEDEVSAAFAGLGVPHCIITGQHERYNAFKASRFALAASGTVSLELAACGTPHIIAYKFNFLTNKIIKRLATTSYANLLNILAQRFVVPEFVLENCREALITPVVLDMLRHPEKARIQTDEARRYLSALKPENAMPSEMAADTVLRVMGR